MILERLRSGDRGQLERVAREHAPRMLACARRITEDEEEAREAVRAAFEDAARASWRLPERALGSVLRQLAICAALRLLGERCGARQAIGEELELRFLADGHHEAHHRDWGEPEEISARPLLAPEVGRALARLPDSHWAVLVLSDVEGLDPETTSQALGTSVEDTRRRLHRARLALRALLAPCLRRGSQ